MIKKEFKKNIIELMEKQKYGVIATKGENGLYTNLIAFFSSDDLKNIYFVTSNKSKKYYNIKKNPNVSFLIDNRKNNYDDIINATALSITGVAKEIKKNLSEIKNSFIKKHPKLKRFSEFSESVFIDINVKKFIYVNKFQEKKIFLIF